jgi:hypothetical protein
VLFVRDEVYRERASRERLQTVLELVARRLPTSASRLPRPRWLRSWPRDCIASVTIGFLRGNKVHVDAVSHSAQFKEHQPAAFSVGRDGGAMIRCTRLYPPVAGRAATVSRAHEELAGKQGSGAICTVPLACANGVVGAITFERPVDRPFDEDALELCEAVGGSRDRCSSASPRRSMTGGTRLLVVPRAVREAGRIRHLGFKLAGLIVAAIALFPVREGSIPRLR